MTTTQAQPAIGGNRRAWRIAVDSMKTEIAAGRKVEVLTGPCAPMTVHDSATVAEYARCLDAWYFPAPGCIHGVR